jgi:tetratricopeptide (TPR) repeat protein
MDHSQSPGPPGQPVSSDQSHIGNPVHVSQHPNGSNQTLHGASGMPSSTIAQYNAPFVFTGQDRSNSSTLIPVSQTGQIHNAIHSAYGYQSPYVTSHQLAPSPFAGVHSGHPSAPYRSPYQPQRGYAPIVTGDSLNYSAYWPSYAQPEGTDDFDISQFMTGQVGRALIHDGYVPREDDNVDEEASLQIEDLHRRKDYSDHVDREGDEDEEMIDSSVEDEEDEEQEYLEQFVNDPDNSDQDEDYSSSENERSSKCVQSLSCYDVANNCSSEPTDEGTVSDGSVLEESEHVTSAKRKRGGATKVPDGRLTDATSKRLHETPRGSGRGRGKGRGNGRGGWRAVLALNETSGISRPQGRPKGSKNKRSEGRGRGRGSGRGRGRRGRGGQSGSKLQKRSPLTQKLLSDATTAYLAEDLDQAIIALEKVIQESPGEITAYTMLSEIHRERGDVDKAITAKIAGAHTQPGNGKNWREIGELCLEHSSEDRNKYWTQATFLFSRAIAADQTDYKSMRYRAQLSHDLGYYRRAAKEYERLLEEQPHDIEALCGMAANYIDFGTPERALPYFHHVIEYCQSVEEEPGEAPDFTFGWSEVNIYIELLAHTKQYAMAIQELKILARWQVGRKDEDYWDKFQDDDREWDLDHEPRRILDDDFVMDHMENKYYGEGLPPELRVKLGEYRLRMAATLPVDETTRRQKQLDEAMVSASLLIRLPGLTAI